MSKKRGQGGIGSTLSGLIWALVMIGVVLAGLKAMGANSMEDSLKIAKDKAIQYSECIPAKECGLSSLFDDIKEIINGDGSMGGNLASGSNKPPKEIELPDGNFDGMLIDRETKGYRGPAKGEPYVNNSGLVNKDAAYSMLNELKVIPDKESEKKEVNYSRKEWKHWTNIDGKPCWNTRSEILNRDAVPGTVKYVNKKKEESNYEDACVIGIPKEKKGKISIITENAGEWIDPYSGKKINDPKTIDIDHVIPLSNAARNGGQSWSLEQKEKFANDPDNLLATSAKENRSKGDKGPGKYMPPKKTYQCQYAKTYTSLAYKYKLSITESDKKILDKTIKACAS